MLLLRWLMSHISCLVYALLSAEVLSYLSFKSLTLHQKLDSGASQQLKSRAVTV